MSKARIYAMIVLSIFVSLGYFIPYFPFIAAIIVAFIFFYSKKDEENTYR